MVAFNQDFRISSAGPKFTSGRNRLAERVRHYFDEHPEVARDEFLIDAVRRELNFREQGKTRNVVGTVRRDGEGIDRRITIRPPSDDEIRSGAVLLERLAILHYERHGLWPRLRRFLFGNREVRLPELPRRQTGKR